MDSEFIDQKYRHKRLHIGSKNVHYFTQEGLLSLINYRPLVFINLRMSFLPKNCKNWPIFWHDA